MCGIVTIIHYSKKKKKLLFFDFFCIVRRKRKYELRNNSKINYNKKYKASDI